jgi:hypothetical protein
MMTTLKLTGLLLGLGLLAAGCDSRQFGGEPYPIGSLHFPLSLTRDPTQRWAFVVNANFDLAYRSGAVSLLDTATNRVVPGVGVEVGSFGGNLELLVRDGAVVRGYLPVREGDALYLLDVGTQDGHPMVSCSADGAVTCDEAHRVTRVTEDTEIGDDPFGAVVYYDAARDADLLVVTELAGGGADVFELGPDGTPTGLGRIELNAPGMLSPIYVPETGRLVVPNKFYDQLITFAVDFDAQPLAARDRRDLSLPVSLSSQDYFHAVLQVGRTLYVADRNSDSIVVVDALTERITGTLPAIPGVTSLAYAQPGLLLATSFEERRIVAIDLGARAVIKVVGLLHKPYDVATVDLPDLGLKRAFFTSFNEGRVGAIELDPASPRFLELLSLIK